MSDELRDKIYDILFDIWSDGLDQNDRQRSITPAVKSIEQAFKDAGYVHMTASAETLNQMEKAEAEYQHIGGFMTGQEWYDRLEHEMNESTEAPETKAWDAARRAAGLLESEKVTDAELLDPKNLANLSQTYRNDDTAFQAQEYRPTIKVDPTEPVPIKKGDVVTYNGKPHRVTKTKHDPKTGFTSVWADPTDDAEADGHIKLPWEKL